MGSWHAAVAYHWDEGGALRNQADPLVAFTAEQVRRLTSLSQMHFVLDEDADARVGRFLLTRGHIVQFSREILWQQAPDHLVKSGYELDSLGGLAGIKLVQQGAAVVAPNRKIGRCRTSGNWR